MPFSNSFDQKSSPHQDCKQNSILFFMPCWRQSKNMEPFHEILKGELFFSQGFSCSLLIHSSFIYIQICPTGFLKPETLSLVAVKFAHSLPTFFYHLSQGKFYDFKEVHTKVLIQLLDFDIEYEWLVRFCILITWFIFLVMFFISLNTFSCLVLFLFFLLFFFFFYPICNVNIQDTKEKKTKGNIKIQFPRLTYNSITP